MSINLDFILNGQLYTINETVVNSMIITLLLIIFAFIANKKIEAADPNERPKGLVNVLEMIYKALTGLIYSTMGRGATRDKLVPYIGTLAVFLLCSNWFGLLGFSPPTSDYNVTLSLTLITAIMIQYYGIKTDGLGGYLKSYVEPVKVMLPLNILGLFADPISMSFRLFGNILSGGIIMGLVYGALKLFAPIAFPLHAYFDLFSGAVQTFIFVMLTMVFVSSNLPDEA